MTNYNVSTFSPRKLYRWRFNGKPYRHTKSERAKRYHCRFARLHEIPGREMFIRYGP